MQFHARRFVASGHPQLHDAESARARSRSAPMKSPRDSGRMGRSRSIVAAGNVHGTRNTPVGEDGIDAGRIQVDLATH